MSELTEALLQASTPPRPETPASAALMDEQADLEDSIFEARTLGREQSRREGLMPWLSSLQKLGLPPGPEESLFRAAAMLRQASNGRMAALPESFAYMNREMTDRRLDPRRLDAVLHFLGALYNLSGD